MRQYMTAYSPLESVCYAQAHVPEIQSEYTPACDFHVGYTQPSTTQYTTTPTMSAPRVYAAEIHALLKPGFLHPFVGDAVQVEQYVRQACKALEIPFPDDVCIRICTDHELQEISPGAGVLGVSINRKDHGLVSDVFIREGTLDKVMLTIGHELGHVLTHRLPNIQDEEAKAFAFTCMWIKAIKAKNIAGLGATLRDIDPARNGVHDTAQLFVQHNLKLGKRAREIYRDLIMKEISVLSPSIS